MNKSVLSNKLTVYTEKKDSSSMATFSIVVKAGSYQESDHVGIAHFVEHMVFKGTKNRTSQEIMEAIEDTGGEINAMTTFEYTKYYATVASEHWKVAANVISDVVFNSTLPKSEFELEKTVIQEELKMYFDDSGNHVQEMLIEEMYPSYKNRRSIGGTVQSVGAMTIEDLVDFKNTFYHPENMFIVVTGHIEHDEVVDFMEQFIKESNLSYNNDFSYEKPSFTPDILKFNTKTLERNIEQAHLSWGLFGPSASDVDAPATHVASMILGGIFSSRLVQLVREQRGLCYTISTGYDKLSDTGMITGYTGLQPDKLDEVKKIIVQQFEKLRTELVSDKELQRAINVIKTKRLSAIENQSFINSQICSAIILGTSTDPMDYIKKIEAVTKEDIKNVAVKYFRPDNWQFSKIIPK